jgi:hypothetical protein
MQFRAGARGRPPATRAELFDGVGIDPPDAGGAVTGFSEPLQKVGERPAS